jgi:hypothetical protein
MSYLPPTPQQAPRKTNTTAVVVVLVVAALCVIGSVIGAVNLLGGGSETPSQPSHAATTAAKPATTPPGDQAVYARIAGMTDCAALQKEFDTAATNHDADLKRGTLDLAKISTAYMQAAQDRMRAVGCN